MVTIMHLIAVMV